MKVVGIFFCVFAGAYFSLAPTGLAQVESRAPEQAAQAPVVPAQPVPAERGREVATVAHVEAAMKSQAAIYEARLDAMETQAKSLDRFMQLASVLGGAIAAFAVVFAFIFGRSLEEVRRSAARTAKNEIDDALRSTNREKDTLAGTIEQVKSVLEELSTIREELSGYTTLAEVARSASGFDPLVQYYEIEREIDARARRSGATEDDTPISETIRDPAFRQRAALVFENILKSVNASKKVGQHKIDPVTLYNIAASASTVEMDFVALQLMEVAEELSGGRAPEITSRLIRQRLSMVHLSDKEAKASLATVLQRTTGFDLHLVLSEASNIGARLSDPSSMSDFILANLPEGLRKISVTQLYCARLKLVGNSLADWEVAPRMFRSGLKAFAAEPQTTRWFETSANEIGRILEVMPEFETIEGEHLSDVLGRWESIEGFVKRYGIPVARSFQRSGLLGALVYEPAEPPLG